MRLNNILTIFVFVFVLNIGLVTAYNGNYCNRTNTPCSLTGDGESICTSTNLYGMYLGYDFDSDVNDVGNISGWDTSCITDMQLLFQMSNFNQDISSWDVSQVINFGSMFSSATSFNQPIGNWNTISATDLSAILGGASSFNQDLSNWNVEQVTTLQSALGGTAIDIFNYNSILSSWSQQNVLTGVPFGAPMFYSNQTARDILTNTYSWIISGDSYSCLENWVQNNSDCINNSYIIQYYDSYNCGTTYYLPSDSGNTMNCTSCVESWLENNTVCNGYNYTVQYYDENSCNSTTYLPIDNDTIILCEISCNWTQTIQPCLSNIQFVSYTSNATFCTELVPSNNNTYINCTIAPSSITFDSDSIIFSFTELDFIFWILIIASIVIPFVMKDKRYLSIYIITGMIVGVYAFFVKFKLDKVNADNTYFVYFIFSIMLLISLSLIVIGIMNGLKALSGESNNKKQYR